MTAFSRKILRALTVVLVFVASVVGMSLMTNMEHVDMTTEMAEAVLPVVYLQKDGSNINELFGYRGEMDATRMRDSILPISQDREVSVLIQAYTTEVEDISYEVRSLDGQRLLEETQVIGFVQKDESIQTTFTLENLLEKEQEYLLIIQLVCDGEEVSYYTRVIWVEDWYVDESIEFVRDFHDKTFDDVKYADLAVHLEANTEGNNAGLNHVTLHSTLRQIAWGDFQGEALKEPILSIKEINRNFNTIVMEYVMASEGENGETEFYNVEEYYRVRYSVEADCMYLLNFERTMDEIFRGEGKQLAGNTLNMGIRDEKVVCAANETSTIAAFVQEGELWSFNCNTQQLYRVYSFRGIEGMSDRENNDNHDIRIIRVDGMGNIDFVVYGYMNRGTHEGYTGVGLYHFDSSVNTIQERLFIQSKEPYEVLKETWGNLFYVSGEGDFYLLAESGLYCLPLDRQDPELVQEDLTKENTAVSENGRYIAWRDQKTENILIVMDLENKSQWQVQGTEGKALVPVGFVESDFVYGIGTFLENGKVLIERIRILDSEQNVVKEYGKEGYYVTEAYVERGTVYLKRATISGSGLREAESDAIMNSKVESGQGIKVESSIYGSKQKQIVLTFSQELSGKTSQLLTPKEVLVEEQRTATLEADTLQEHYFVYAAGKVELYTSNLPEAIQEADERAGVVVGENQEYFWRRGRTTVVSLSSQAALSDSEYQDISNYAARCLTVMLKGQGVTFDINGMAKEGVVPERILQEAMPDAVILNLTGCSMPQLLYYIDQGHMVYAMGSDHVPRLIVGYDVLNVILYDPTTNSVYRETMENGTSFFAEGGNVFITCLEN